MVLHVEEDGGLQIPPGMGFMKGTKYIDDKSFLRKRESRNTPL
jgi:hypothetical protein